MCSSLRCRASFSEAEKLVWDMCFLSFSIFRQRPAVRFILCFTIWIALHDRMLSSRNGHRLHQKYCNIASFLDRTPKEKQNNFNKQRIRQPPLTSSLIFVICLTDFGAYFAPRVNQTNWRTTRTEDQSTCFCKVSGSFFGWFCGNFPPPSKNQ